MKLKKERRMRVNAHETGVLHAKWRFLLDLS